MTIVNFSFGKSSIRTLGDPCFPLFIASDLADILGYSSTKDATRILDDDEKQTVVIETNGGKQSMTAVTESGLFALILRSRKPEAKAFRKWVTSEVLPAIRKTGRYELPRDTITPEEQHRIRKAVASNALRTHRHYQTVYNDLYDAFEIPRYQELKRSDFPKALKLLGFETDAATPSEGSPLVLSGNEVNQILSMIYALKYQYKGVFESFNSLLQSVNSPYAGTFYEFSNLMILDILEEKLNRLGYRVQDLRAYQRTFGNTSTH